MDCAARITPLLAISFVGFLACSQDSGTAPGGQVAAGTNATPPMAAGASAAGTSGESSATAPAGAGAAGARAATGGAGASAAGAAGSAVATAGTVAQSSGGAGAPAAGTGAGAGASGGAAAGAGGSGAGTGGSGGAGGASAAGAGGVGAPGGDLAEYAKALHNVFIDVPCASGTPMQLARMATCMHAPNTQHIDKTVMFGGETGKTYLVTLRVRGIWEPTKIQGGMRADTKVPFTVGGMVPAGNASSDPINYQQYSINVATPKQVYWLNDHQYVAHDIHKVDYQAKIEVAGGSMVTITMHDGNDHEIANWTMDYFEGLPPYDKKPSLGQMLQLDVVSVTVK